MSLHYCINGCDVPATRQWNKGREVKVAGLPMFKCPKCNATFSAPCVVRPKPSSVLLSFIKAYTEGCPSCHSGTVRFTEMDFLLGNDLSIAVFGCSGHLGRFHTAPCGHTIFFAAYMWEDLFDMRHPNIRSVVSLHDQAEKEGLPDGGE